MTLFDKLAAFFVTLSAAILGYLKGRDDYAKKQAEKSAEVSKKQADILANPPSARDRLRDGEF